MEEPWWAPLRASLRIRDFEALDRYEVLILCDAHNAISRFWAGGFVYLEMVKLQDRAWRFENQVALLNVVIFTNTRASESKLRQRSPLYEMDWVGLFGHWILHGMDSEYSLSNKGENEERNLYKHCSGEKEMYIKKHLGKQIKGRNDCKWRRGRENEIGGTLPDALL